MNYPYKKDWWETKDHKKIKISDMETSHIKNTIKYLQRHKDFYDEGGGDYWDVDSWWYEDNSHLVYKKIDELENELERRMINNEKSTRSINKNEIILLLGR